MGEGSLHPHPKDGEFVTLRTPYVFSLVSSLGVIICTSKQNHLHL